MEKRGSKGKMMSNMITFFTDITLNPNRYQSFGSQTVKSQSSSNNVEQALLPCYHRPAVHLSESCCLNAVGLPAASLAAPEANMLKFLMVQISSTSCCSFLHVRPFWCSCFTLSTGFHQNTARLSLQQSVFIIF